MPKPRILIVDDEPGFIRLLKLVLEKTGRYSVREENDAARVVVAAKEFHPDLVLLDFVMPKMDGGAVASRIRSVPQLRDTPIVFLSASVVQEKGGAAQIAGFPAIPKPIGVGELVEAIDANLAVPPAKPFNKEESFLSSLARRLRGEKGLMGQQGSVFPIISLVTIALMFASCAGSRESGRPTVYRGGQGYEQAVHPA